MFENQSKEMAPITGNCIVLNDHEVQPLINTLQELSINAGEDYSEAIEVLNDRAKILAYETRSYKGKISPKEYNDKLIEQLNNAINILKSIALLTDADRKLIKSAVKSGNLKNLNLIAILDKRKAERNK